MGSIGILNVGAGDTKLTFDPNNPAELIRSKRIVQDMLRRGYALLVEVPDGQGGKIFARATGFRDDTCEYIIADFDPITAQEADRHEQAGQEGPTETPATEGAEEGEAAASHLAGVQPYRAPTAKQRKARAETRVPAASTRAVAVGRSAGG